MDNQTEARIGLPNRATIRTDSPGASLLTPEDRIFFAYMYPDIEFHVAEIGGMYAVLCKSVSLQTIKL
jgi:hypothetical protein